MNIHTKYKKSHQLNFLLFYCALVFFCSCKKLVTVDAPENLILSEKVFSTKETANAAMLNIYAKLVDEDILPYNIPYFTGLLGDELRNNSNSTAAQQLYKNQLNINSSPTDAIWNRGYAQIYQANAVIEGCIDSPIPIGLKKQLTAEAKFIRAFWHFNLFNLYGDIPVITTTDYKLNSNAPKQHKEVVFNQIISDLLDAERNLTADFVGADGFSITTERLRPNKYSATALLGRVYLYNEDFNNAVIKATSVLTNTSSFDTTSLSNVFLKNSKESLWQLMKPSPNTTNINTQEGFRFTLTTKPRTTGLNESSTISTQLLSSFEAGDGRLRNWVGIYKDMATAIEYRFPAKYKVKSGANLTEYSTVMRIAEQYLIRAEANARLQKPFQAIQDLDVIRKRAGLPLIGLINPNINGEALVDIITHERRIEFFCEWGHRWMDMKRMGIIDNTMTLVAQKGGGWKAENKYLPIPLFDRQNNTNLGD